MNLLLVGLVAMVGVSFGPGYQTLSVLILPTLVFLLWNARKHSSHFVLPVIWVACMIGSCFAYAGSFETTSSPSINSPKTRQVVGHACLFSMVMSIIFSVDRIFYRSSVYDQRLDFLLGFPSFWVFGWQLFYQFHNYGNFGSWHVALALMNVDYLTVGASWLLGSFFGGCAIVAVLSTLCFHAIEYFLSDGVDLLKKYSNSAYSSHPSKLMYFFTLPYFWALLYIFSIALIGSLKMLPSGSFYQQPIQQFAPKTFEAACLIRGNFESTISLLESSNVPPFRRPQLILWSEASVTTRNATQLVERAQIISAQYSVILGVAYSEVLSQNPLQVKNMFALVAPTHHREPSSNVSDSNGSQSFNPFSNANNSTLDTETLNATSSAEASLPNGHFRTENTTGFVYQKTHPVPAVESGTLAGDGEMFSLRTPFGQIGAAM